MSPKENAFSLIQNYNNVQQFEALFNYATIGIVVTSDKGVIINFNKYAEIQFGYTKDQILGKTVEVLLPASVHSRHIKYREDYYQDPQPRIMGHGRDLFAQNKDGNTFPVEVSLSHYVINNQTFIIAFVIDITVRKNHESLEREQKSELERITTEIKKMNTELETKVADRTKMLREALEELEKSKEELNEAFENEKELSELKSRFVTMASHEFRTPLSTILSSAYLIEKYNEHIDDGRILKHIQRIKGAVGGMKNILEDFLSLGKLEEGLVNITMEKTTSAELSGLLNNLVEELEPLLKHGQQFLLKNDVNRDVWVDRSLLKNIMTNLVSNAIKFTGENCAIDIHADFTESDLTISVSDNGIGISEEDQQHLFERFFRAKNALNIQGTGLGLHIVGKYLELMKGKISLTSKIEEGSTFIISIPQQSFYSENKNEKDPNN